MSDKFSDLFTLPGSLRYFLIVIMFIIIYDTYEFEPELLLRKTVCN
jgi:hypothetical protein